MSDDTSRPGVRVVAGGRRSTTTAMRRRAEAIKLTMLGTSVPDIATSLGVSERHVRRLLREPSVREQIAALDRELLKAVSRRAATLAPHALTVLGQIFASKSEPPAARVSAAGRTLDLLLKVTELAELSERIDRLEEQMTPRGGPSSWAHRRD